MRYACLRSRCSAGRKAKRPSSDRPERWRLANDPTLRSRVAGAARRSIDVDARARAAQSRERAPSGGRRGAARRETGRLLGFCCHLT